MEVITKSWFKFVLKNKKSQILHQMSQQNFGISRHLEHEMEGHSVEPWHPKKNK